MLFTQPYGVMKYSVPVAPRSRLLQQDAECPEEGEDAHPAAAVRSKCLQESSPPPPPPPSDFISAVLSAVASQERWEVTYPVINFNHWPLA